MSKSSWGSARGAKSSQGSRTGTCGWITSLRVQRSNVPPLGIKNTYLELFLSMEVEELLKRQNTNSLNSVNS